MKRFIIPGIAALGFALALPAYGQTQHSGGGVASPLGTGTGGGGGYGGGGGAGGGNTVTPVDKLPAYARSCFCVTAVSGSKMDYVPSVFVTYDKAIASGQAIDDAPAPTVAEAARAQRAAAANTEKSKFTVVQNYYGYPIVVPR